MANRAQRLSGINTLAYLGIEPITAPYLVVDNRAPTSDDRVGNQIGAVWVVMASGNPVDPLTAEVWFLVSVTGTPPGGAVWIQLEQSGGGMAIEQIVTDNGTVIPLANSITERGGPTSPNPVTNINTYANPNGSENMVIALNNSITQPNTSADGTKGVYTLGGAGGTFMHNYGTRNTWLGANAGNLTLTVGSATDDTGLGFQALNAVTTASSCVAVGSTSLHSLQVGDSNCALGAFSLQNLNNSSNNTALGHSAMQNATPAGVGNNVAVGDFAMRQVTGTRNVGVGTSALSGNGVNATCIGSTAVGYHALFANTSGINTVIGYEAGDSLTTGSNNFCGGFGALGAEITGSDTVCIGDGAGASQNGGAQNVILGSGASPLNLTGAGNVILGYQAYATSGGSGSSNVAIGWHAMGGLSNSSAVAIGYNALGNGTGAGNATVAIGHRVMESAVGVIHNSVVIGSRAGSNLQTDNNTIIGDGGFALATLGSENTVVGYNVMPNYIGLGQDNNCVLGVRCLENVVQCNDNIAIGADAMFSNASAVTDGRGSSNIAIGDRSLFALNPAAAPDSTYNVSIGVQAGFGLVTGIENVFLGRLAGSAYTGAESNNICLGFNTLGTVGESNTTRIGVHGTQTAAYMGGVSGVVVANPLAVYINSATGQLGTGAGAPSIQTATVVLTSAQVKNLVAVPITIVASPGAGSYIVPIRVTAKMTYGGTNVFVAGAGQAVELRYVNAAGEIVAQSVMPNAGIVSAASYIGFGSNFNVSDGLATSYENQAIVAVNSTVTDVTGNAANNNTITIVVTYEVLTI